jgi:hypothetical protein
MDDSNGLARRSEDETQEQKNREDGTLPEFPVVVYAVKAR